MIKIELDKKDLLSLVRGTEPDYPLMQHPLIKKYGDYTGGFLDKWSWHNWGLEDATEEELYQIYILCKKSWER